MPVKKDIKSYSGKGDTTLSVISGYDYTVIRKDKPVKVTGKDGSIKIYSEVTATTDVAVGFSQLDCLKYGDDTTHFPIGYSGIQPVTYEGTVTAGDTLILGTTDPTALRTAVPVADGGAAVRNGLGVALEDGVDGDEGSMLIGFSNILSE